MSVSPQDEKDGHTFEIPNKAGTRADTGRGGPRRGLRSKLKQNDKPFQCCFSSKSSGILIG